MVDPNFREIEELVQASVFHPSPCRRLRERVLHDAGQARWRQQVKQRGLIAALLVSFAVSVPLVVHRWQSSAAAPRTSAPPAQAAAAPSGPTPRRDASPASFGEAVLRGTTAAEPESAGAQP